MTTRLILASTMMLGTVAAGAQSCNTAYWRTFNGVHVYRVKACDRAADFPCNDQHKPYFYVTRRISIDADGAPKAYHPDGKSGLDDLRNAGYPNSPNWPAILVPDPANQTQALIRKDGDAAGFYYSKTTLADPNPRKKNTDDGKFADATKIPYIAFPGNWLKVVGSGAMGNHVMARAEGGREDFGAVVADRANANDPLGEISIALAERFYGHPVNGRSVPPGGPASFAYAVFPSPTSQVTWPLDSAVIDKRARAMLQAVGGWPAEGCLQPPPQR